MELFTGSRFLDRACYVLVQIKQKKCSEKFMKGIALLHSGYWTIAAKVMRIGYYWPTIHKDAAEWAINIVGPITACSGGIKFLVVAIDYFTKWVEAKALVTITSRRIATSFGKILCAVAHPQATGKCEVTNRDIVKGINARLVLYGNEWFDEIPSVLWAHQTTHKNSTEILVPTKRVQSFDESSNGEGLRANLDMLEECREIASTRESMNKHKISKYYDKRVKPLSFKVGEYVWRNNEARRA
ncbi:uncharacterized protein [Rutidosis leptorrhynchoides]|uniref:uncharacterized protein n=1 Tax=Rutidosis leptorrhynchoides TaxID=125765 RepID=UPI003A9987F3